MSETFGLHDELELGDDENQFLTFVLNGEEYGLRILKVQEIKGFTGVTPIPGTPAYIKGVMNLRGTVVPVVDLRAKFGMPAAEYDKFTVIVVVDVGPRIVGLIVDAVSDVLNFADGDVAPPPMLGTDIDTSFLTGMAKAGEKLVLLLDIDAVIGAEVAAIAA
ncbi:MAG TPA: chemotaxis protein CheW [Gemmatimonadaceae bacterium]|nr:chemotaxis protein CheW [Gemmatimonadaceae bacterium]